MKLYHNGSAWQLPGQQDKAAKRADVPNSPADLAAWLNDRRVPVTPPLGAAECWDGKQLEQSDYNVPAVSTEGAVITGAELERVNEQRPPFLPRLSAEEIERHRMASNQCPKCGNGGAYLRSLEESNVCDWFETAELDRIQRVIEHARAVVRGRGAVLEGEGRAH